MRGLLLCCDGEDACNNSGMNEQAISLATSRRRFLGVCSAIGLGQTLLPGVLFGMAAEAQSPVGGAAAKDFAKITPEMIDAAGVIAGVTVTAEQKTMMLEGLTRQRDSVAVIRTMKIPNDVAPAFVFDPVPGGMVLDTVRKPLMMSGAPNVKALRGKVAAGLAGDSDALAFATVRELAELVKTRTVSSVELK